MDKEKLYILIEPQEVGVLGIWAQHYPGAKVVGYSVLGHIFLQFTKSGEIKVLHPFKKACKSYGVFPSVAEFEDGILKDPGFTSFVLRPEHVAAVAKHVGPLADGEVYIPEPYPFLGGSDEPNTYGKGNVWAFVTLVGSWLL